MVDKAVVKTAFSEFAANLYDKVIEEQGGKLDNVFLSPLSIYLASMMCMAGADGETLQEMHRTLHIPNHLSAEDAHVSIGPILLKYFETPKDIEISLANRLFLLKNAKINEKFSQTLSKQYKAATDVISSLNNAEAQRKHMNHWVAENTQNKIVDLIPPGGVSANTVLAITNALYFRGSWEHPFIKEATRQGDFHCLDGTTIEIQMMYKEATYPMAELPEYEAQAIKLPFRDTNWSMLIVLPNDVKGLPRLLSHLRQPGKLSALLARGFDKAKCELHMPKFKLDGQHSMDVKKLLEACGMRLVFTSSADLSKMCNTHKLFISDALHKAVLEVDEEGATAAAATGMMIAVMCYQPSPVIRVDHPFFVALVCDSNVPVFVGHVLKPEKN
ncbi:Leukocyte elastase inhibitor B [Paragonimus heterotremus]|uniref:Leukocyte elastase inhibitor B n=1 Tax=Paragonimus heterotremus TaxID=100268 RepID=A0A8J4SXX2_9TREM|nr:Leukocyte elastase inhibitor B [Paragonimus heterotremus]